jgi:hypothetical protein
MNGPDRAVRARGPAVASIVIAVLAGAAGQRARADRPRDTPAAIEVDRDTAPAGRVGFGFDGGEPVDAWGASIAATWIARPIALDAGAFGGGSPPSEPVRRRETLTLGGAFALGEAVVLEAALRASHQLGDRLRAAGNPDGLARYVVHDLQLGGRIRVVGDDERAALLRADLTLPSGNAEQFAGDASWTAAWRLIGRATLARGIAVAANAGIRLHGAEVAVGDHVIGNALFAAAGVAAPLSALGMSGVAERVAVTAELEGSLGDHVGQLSAPSPLELRLGAIVRATPALSIAVRAGFGLDDQIGAPSFRAVLAAAWTPRVERPAGPAQPAAQPAAEPGAEPPVEPPDEPPDEPDDEPPE